MGGLLPLCSLRHAPRHIHASRAPLLLLGSLLIVPRFPGAASLPASRGREGQAALRFGGAGLRKTRPPAPHSAFGSRALSLKGGTQELGVTAQEGFAQSGPSVKPDAGLAYYDVDGTLYDGTMAHTAWWFVGALPSPLQRAAKFLQILVGLPFIGLVAAVNEGTAAGLLAYIATKGVAVADARAASRAVTRGVGSRAYAEVVEHLRLQQAEGRAVTLLTGNITPCMDHLASSLGCAVVGTEVEVREGFYTGRVAGAVCVGEEKRRRLTAAVAPPAGCTRPTNAPPVVGVGNSMYDVPFLEASTSAAVVRPSRRLRRLALARSWDLTLDSVHSSRIEFPGTQEPRAGAMRVLFRAAYRSLEFCVAAAYLLALSALWRLGYLRRSA